MRFGGSRGMGAISEYGWKKDGGREEREGGREGREGRRKLTISPSRVDLS